MGNADVKKQRKAKLQRNLKDNLNRKKTNKMYLYDIASYCTMIAEAPRMEAYANYLKNLITEYLIGLDIGAGREISDQQDSEHLQKNLRMNRLDFKKLQE